MLTTIVLMPVATFLLLGVDKPDTRNREKEYAPLQGTWKLASQARGEAVNRFENPPRWVVKGNRVFYGGEPLAVLTIDAAAAPKVIDLDFVKTKKVYEGIYELDKDTWKICVNVQTDGVKARPQTFSTKGNESWRMLVFERAPAGEDPLEGTEGFVGLVIRLAVENQVMIENVLDDSPAKKAGLKKDDTVLKVGGAEATDLPGVVDMIRRTKPGGSLVLRIQRDGKELDVTVKPGVMPFRLLE
jgi:uncharacterized protein (TIGR03067 family)